MCIRDSLYGWRELLSAKEDVDDETIGVIAIFFGVMLDVENAAMSLASFASSTVMNTVKKQVTKQLLVKTSWYRAVKKTLRSIGVNLTKKAFNQGFSKVLPVIGGVAVSYTHLDVYKRQAFGVRVARYRTGQP